MASRKAASISSERKTVSENWLTGKLLVATPAMPDPRFARAVVYLWHHSDDAAMGLVINRLYGELNFRSLLSQLDVSTSAKARELPVHFGGPVEPMRGFVLHSTDYVQHGSIAVNDLIAVTATVDVLRALAEGAGPQKALFALGYTGWTAGQLEIEIQENNWLITDATEDLVFGNDTEGKWAAALAMLGISPTSLAVESGRA